MYDINKKKFGSVEKFILSNTSTKEFFSIIPAVGANINELVLSKSAILHSVIDGYQCYEELIEDKGSKSAFLIPFPNRVSDGKYKFNKKQFQLPVNNAVQNHAIHGLLYNKPFKVVELIAEDKFAAIELSHYYKNDPNVFPSGFVTNLKIILNSDGLRIKISVKNTGNSDMPFGAGWHPYFKLDEKIDQLQLKLPPVSKIMVDKRMIPTGTIDKDNRFKNLININSAQLDDGFIIDDESDWCETRLYSPLKNTSIKCWQEIGPEKFNYLQVYTPPGRCSIAVEPMTCATNSFNNKEGLIVLKPGDQFESTFGVGIY